MFCGGILTLAKKRGEVSWTVVFLVAALFFMIVALFITQSITSRSSRAMQIQICKASISARIRTTIQAPGRIDIHLSPLMCDTLEYEFPEKKYTEDNLKNGTMNEIAETLAIMADMVNFGKAHNLYHEGFNNKDICYVVATFSINSKDEIDITREDFEKYLEEYPFKVITKRPENGDENGQPRITNVCESYGGVCRYTCLAPDYIEYSSWSCGRGLQRCCVDRSNVISYQRYITRNCEICVGPGYIAHRYDKFEKNTEYAITLASPKRARDILSHLIYEGQTTEMATLIISEVNRIGDEDICSEVKNVKYDWN